MSATTQSPWKQLSPALSASTAATPSSKSTTALSEVASPKTMQQIMDEELALKLYEDECKALEKQMALAELTAQQTQEDENAYAFDGECEQEQEGDGDDDDDDYDDYMDSYSVGAGKSVQMIGQYVPLANTTKGFNSLRENMRRQDKGDTRKGPVRNVLESGKFASRDSAFDERTRMVLLKLMNRGKLEVVHERINTGKEANTYRAVGSDDETGRELRYAIKIFKTSRGDFNKSNECDPSGRVYNENFIKKTLRRQLKEWTEKEYKNLLRAASCGVQAPKPLLFKDHVLVMHFVGEDGTPALKLRDIVLTKSQLNLAYVDVMRSVRTLYQSAQLVHSRLSESNILYHDDRCWLIDFSEATERTHPDHGALLDQDLAKIHSFFESKGMRRVSKDSLGMLSAATAREFVTSEDPESFLKYYPTMKALLLAKEQTDKPFIGVANGGPDEPLPKWLPFVVGGVDGWMAVAVSVETMLTNEPTIVPNRKSNEREMYSIRMLTLSVSSWIHQPKHSLVVAIHPDDVIIHFGFAWPSHPTVRHAQHTRIRPSTSFVTRRDARNESEQPRDVVVAIFVVVAASRALAHAYFDHVLARL